MNTASMTPEIWEQDIQYYLGQPKSSDILYVGDSEKGWKVFVKTEEPPQSVFMGYDEEQEVWT